MDEKLIDGGKAVCEKLDKLNNKNSSINKADWLLSENSICYLSPENEKIKAFQFSDWAVNCHLGNFIKKRKGLSCIRIYRINNPYEDNSYLFLRTLDKTNDSVEHYDLFVENGKELNIAQTYSLFIGNKESSINSYNLPTRGGLEICRPFSIKVVEEEFEQEPLDGGAGKIKELDSKIFDIMISKGIKPNWRNAEADWVITDKAIFYINPVIGAVYPFSFEEWILVFGRNRAYGLNKSFAALNIVSRTDKENYYTLKTSNVAQQNISYIFSKFEK
tara:strand:+ start:1013 stop:1837 length:825 start_codon:yes stop_codon:yes gene_type:complete